MQSGVRILSRYLRDACALKMTLYLKFLNLTVKVGRKKNKIGNIKIIINLLTEVKSKLETYPERT